MGTTRTSRRFRGDAFIAECYVIFSAIMFYLEIGFMDLILEGDAKQVTSVVEGNEPNWSVGALINK